VVVGWSVNADCALVTVEVLLRTNVIRLVLCNLASSGKAGHPNPGDLDDVEENETATASNVYKIRIIDWCAVHLWLHSCALRIMCSTSPGVKDTKQARPTVLTAPHKWSL
jgi:hypothetical protein